MLTPLSTRFAVLNATPYSLDGEYKKKKVSKKAATTMSATP
jgi:uncharacterized small protein (DUF1192 family)